jgi:hypothetical protein
MGITKTKQLTNSSTVFPDHQQYSKSRGFGSGKRPSGMPCVMRAANRSTEDQ